MAITLTTLLVGLLVVVTVPLVTVYLNRGRPGLGWLFVGLLVVAVTISWIRD